MSKPRADDKTRRGSQLRRAALLVGATPALSSGLIRTTRWWFEGWPLKRSGLKRGGCLGYRIKLKSKLDVDLKAIKCCCYFIYFNFKPLVKLNKEAEILKITSTDTIK